MSGKIDRKQLKGPDQFSQTFATIFERVVQHKKAVYSIVTFIIVVIVAWAGILKYNEKSYQKRFDILYQANKTYQNEIEESQKQKDELEKKERAAWLASKPLKKDNKAGDDKVSAKEQKEKEAFEKELELKLKEIKSTHGKSQALYEDIVKNYVGKDIQIAASLRLARILINKEEFKKAVDVLIKLKQAIKLKGLAKIIVNQNIAFCYESLKEYQKAVEAYRQLVLLGKKKNPIYLQHKVQMGRLYSVVGQNDESKKLYKEIIDSDPQSPEAALSKKMLLL